MSITTKTGDEGTSGLMFGHRAPKSDLRFEALGSLDELNAAIGMARATVTVEELKEVLKALQKEILALGAEVATLPADFDRAKESCLAETAVEAVEMHSKMLEATLAKLTSFVLPGTTPASAALHFARTIARRAERALWRLHEVQPLARQVPLLYLNRLSDLLWVLARTV